MFDEAYLALHQDLQVALANLPCTLYSFRLCRFLKLSIHPLEPLNLSSLSKKANPNAFVESILSVIVRLFRIALYTQIVNASSISGKATFFSRLKPACNELRSMASHLSLSFKISLIIPSLTSY